MESTTCKYLDFYGNCPESGDCEYCSVKKRIKLDPNSTDFVPKKKTAKITENQTQPTENIKLNLNAKEYVPKNFESVLVKDDEECDFDDDEENNKEVEVIIKDIIENEEIEEDSEDEDKWYPLFRDCECCQGYIYLCKGSTCQNLKYCFCKVKYDIDQENQ